jgi:hypothetical protein
LYREAAECVDRLSMMTRIFCAVDSADPLDRAYRRQNLAPFGDQ